MLDAIVNFLSEDPVGLLINISFGLMLLPALKDKQKPPVATSLLTGLLLIALSLSGSYRAAAPAFAVGIVGVLWLVLALQRFLKDRGSRGAL